jgi:hypothetical protein
LGRAEHAAGGFTGDQTGEASSHRRVGEVVPDDDQYSAEDGDRRCHDHGGQRSGVSNDAPGNLAADQRQSAAAG